MAARSISCRAWPAATRTFFGVQPRFGQVPPRSCDSIIATDMPARRTGPVTPMPAVPTPNITTSNVSMLIENFPMSQLIVWAPRVQAASSTQPEASTGGVRALLLGLDGRGDGVDNHGRHLELRDTVFDVVALGDPLEIGPHRPDLAVVVLREQQPDRPVQPGIRVRRDELGSERRVSEYQQRRRAKLDPGVGRELRLVDLHEELDALAGD